MRQPARRRRPWLVTVSIGLHFAVVFGLWVTGMWKIEKLEAGHRPFDLAVAPEAQPESGSPEGSPAPVFKVKKSTQTPKEMTKDFTQPPETPKQTDVPATTPSTTATDGTGNGSGSGSGSGSGTGTGTGTGSGSGSGSGSGTSKCLVDCDQTEKVVAPTVIRGLRISGETQIHPPDTVKTEILRDGKTKVVAGFRVCVGTHGEIASLALAKSSGYPAYDAALMTGLRDWRYKPYLLDNKPLPVCGVVTFIYAMQ